MPLGLYARSPKKWDNLKAALALAFAHLQHPSRGRGSLRITPSDGCQDHDVWTIDELVGGYPRYFLYENQEAAKAK